MKNLLILSLWLLIPHFSHSQTKDYKVVFDLTSKDTSDQKNVIRWVNEISKSDASAKLEVVLYGQSLDLIVKNKSPYPDQMTKLLSNKNVSFRVCAVAMKAHNIEKSMLFTGVETVPDGIYEIITKQREGWGYIKVSH